MTSYKFYLANRYVKKITTYTYKLLQYIVEANGHKWLDEPEKADFILVSLIGTRELNVLRTTRRKYKNKPIIAGGHAGYNPELLALFADYVNVGQGFQLFSDLAFDKNIEDLPYIYTPGKKSVHTSTFIHWKLCPIIQIGENTFSYLGSVGCEGKCAYCLTSWSNQLQINPLLNSRISRHIPKHLQLYVISNYALGDQNKRKIADVKIKDAIANPRKYAGITNWRAGVEFISPEWRRRTGKPITDEHIREFLAVAKKYNRQINLFLLAGVEDPKLWLDTDLFYGDHITKPRINFVINYFEPHLGTPVQNFNLTRLIEYPFRKITYNWMSHNGRIWAWQVCDMKLKTTILSVITERSRTMEDFKFTMDMKKAKDHNAIFEAAAKEGFEHLIKGKQHSAVIGPNHEALKRAIRKWVDYE